MKHISPAEADAKGYRSITKDLFPDRSDDKPIVAAMETTLAGCDAVWIDFPAGFCQAARKRNELHLPTDELEKLKLTTAIQILPHTGAPILIKQTTI